MKLKHFFYLLGFKPKPEEYGWTESEFSLPEYGTVRFANWDHPRVKKHVIEERRVNALKAVLRPGDVALDIGAHAGDTSVEMALAVGKGGTVFAFEPNRHVFKILERNSLLNRDKTNIIPFPYAATDGDGELEFHYSDPGFCNGGEFRDVSLLKHGHVFSLPVTGRNIARLLMEQHPEKLDALRYIKIDTEGADFAVLRTLEPIVSRKRPYIRTEINRHMPRQERDAYLAYLRELGYRVVASDENDGPGAEELPEAALSNPRTFDIWALPKEA